MIAFERDLFMLNRIFFLRKQLFLLILIIVTTLAFGAQDANAGAGAVPRLKDFVGLPVPSPNLNKWLSVVKPGAGDVADWQRLFAGKSKAQQIVEVNVWVNSRIEYREEAGDQWVSPHQSLARGYGDCEDFAIAKYYILKSLGFTEDQLYLVVANDLVVRNQHAVLLVNFEGQEQVLDNFTDNIMGPDTALTVIFPEFAFSGRKSWVFGRMTKI